MKTRDSKHARTGRARQHRPLASRDLLLSSALLLAVNACSGTGSKTNDNPHMGTPAAGSGNAGTPSAAGTGGGAMPTAGKGGSTTGPSTGGTGGTTSSAGGGTGGSATGATGGSSALGGGPGNAGNGGATGVGGSVASAGMGGATGASGKGAGGAPGAGTGSGTAGTSSNTAGASGDTTGCTRDLLKSTIDNYFTALATHDASTLPLADSVKFTENGKVMMIGTDGLWKTAGMLKHVHSALDTTICSSASEAVVPDGSMDIPFALRLKLENQKITEVETIAVRPGDYKVSGSNFASDTGAIISSAQTIGWEDPVSADQAPTRDELVSWMDKYFKFFPNGVCNTDSSCKRLENGGGSFNCSAGASCSSGSPPAKPQAVSHVILGDAETGVGAGFDLFTGADTDMHMFKMKGGKVYAVDAILGAATSTGWD
jgi:hypothetical protein